MHLNMAPWKLLGGVPLSQYKIGSVRIVVVYRRKDEKT